MAKVIFEKCVCDWCGSDNHVKQFLLPAPKRISSEEDPEILPVTVDLCVGCYIEIARKIHEVVSIRYDMVNGLRVSTKKDRRTAVD